MPGRLQQNHKAKIVDTLKLQAENPDRMEVAVREAEEYFKGYHTITLVKTWDDWFVYGIDMDGEAVHDFVMVNSKHEVRIGKLYTSEGKHFTSIETSAWRGELLAELLRIQKISPNLDNEQIASEFIGLTDMSVAYNLSLGDPDIYENACQYAEMITM